MYNFDMVAIGKFIASIRKEKGLTQNDLASLVGTNYKQISKWETGTVFPDINKQLSLCKALDISLEELHRGQYDFEERGRKRKNQITKRALIIWALASIPIIGLLLMFFIINVNSFKIYTIESDSNSETRAQVNGIIIDNNKVDIIYIGNMKFLDVKNQDTQISSINIYSDEDLIYHTNDTKNILMKFSKKENIDFDNLNIEAEIITVEDKILNYEVDLIPKKLNKKSNLEKLPVNSKCIDEDKIAMNLLANDFEQTGEDSFEKVIKKDSKNYTKVEFLLDENRVIYVNSSKTIYKFVNFYYDTNIVETNIYFLDDDVKILVEKFTYDYRDGNLNCQVGICSSYEYVLDTMDEYRILLNGD